MRGVPIGSPSRSGYALRLGARIRPTALRSFLPKPEETVAKVNSLYLSAPFLTFTPAFHREVGWG